MQLSSLVRSGSSLAGLELLEIPGTRRKIRLFKTLSEVWKLVSNLREL